MSKKNKKQSKLKVRVQVIPTDGKPVTHNAELAATGASVKEVLSKLGIDPDKKSITMNGAPANLDTHVGPDDVLAARDAGRAPVTVSERPRGS